MISKISVIITTESTPMDDYIGPTPTLPLEINE